jgi:microcin C transport system substrate-binding protein
MHSQYFLHKSYYEDLYGRFHPCDNTEFDYDKDKARALLPRPAGFPIPPPGCSHA